MIKYSLNITGDFSNIQGMNAELTFPAEVTCTCCNVKHDKIVILTNESHKSEKDVYKCNYEMSCHSCRVDMRITIKNPEKQIKKEIKDLYGDPVEVVTCPVGVNGCNVAIFETSGVEINCIKDVALNILTEDDQYFENIHADGTRTVTGEYPPNKIFSITNYNNEIKRIK
ncbi:hypothetical protein NBO_28g0081 [Nosema bombycis CQ1]|uniref:Uncharacterized protein n=1 Tax=Nosema bombycis (strain CQ1 / CVCC 102059) TaxID=578461 RepID=R0KW72_NOSB1|nr:hypothetical protein NBO_28g0081 [Nosema bombycis CQ1]|eukprot:EOB14442.1 hypothetical protein NBO_28g0081 [Nosema bombycis CQ1]